MTSATEARLCREAEICYATLSLATDYDVWHETEEPVTVELVLQNLSYNIANAKAVIKKALAALGKEGSAAAATAAPRSRTRSSPPRPRSRPRPGRSWGSSSASTCARLGGTS